MRESQAKTCKRAERRDSIPSTLDLMESELEASRDPTGCREALFLALRAGDGIRTRESLLGNTHSFSSLDPLEFPWILAIMHSVTRRMK